jgi:tRNA (guanine-N7-)-methyltransferase|tara:strand:- start:1910 stop:2584 length:675 start_codon:yes stop_codon:yes gene_type:complete
MTEQPYRKVRSFVNRSGRLTNAQQKALNQLLPRWGIPFGGPIDMPYIFEREALRVLDIGFGDGEALLTLAANNPTIDYLGIEVHEPGIGHLLLLLERANIANVRIIPHDAVEVLDEMLLDCQFNAVNLFFPDPWPKKRHHKRRLVQASFIQNVSRVLKADGVLHITTDWDDYALHIKEVLKNNKQFSLSTEDESLPLLYRPPTKFERRGRKLGHNVTELYFRLK